MSLTFKEYLISWVTIWLFASFIFIIPKIDTGSIKVFAESSAYTGSSSDNLPKVELIRSNEINKNRAVLGANISASRTNLERFANYPHVAESYRLEPEKTEKILNKITEYKNTYRSYGENSRVPIPVGSEIFLEVSLKYRTPLAYVMTIARLESRFGTHCYQGGNVSRICAHRNIYSMGLDDSGNNITFKTWEDGVESFGMWYSKKINRGMSNCSIWKLYNPNGDYCSKVKMVASQVEEFFQS